MVAPPKSAALDPARAVLNQPPPFLPRNLFLADPLLGEWLSREGIDPGAASSCGAYAGSLEAADHCRRAERNLPRLEPYDRYGRRVDRVELDPSWYVLLEEGVRRGVHSLVWRGSTQLERGVLFVLYAQINGGVMCPLSMTTAAVAALRAGARERAAEVLARLTATDPQRVAIAGMAMTERQGGSDLRQNISRAEPQEDGSYLLYGHKWFCSYPPADLFLILAQAPGGLSCFLVEERAGLEFQRLKDKLGTRSLPSAELELRGARGQLVGEEGQGVKAIMPMVNQTRLDCALAAAAAMRRAVSEAVHHCRYREAFGRPLVEQPAMEAVLFDLALETEGALSLALRLAQAFDRDEEGALRRILTPLVKYWVCKRATGVVGEALECLGGNGYVEESGMPLLLRDAPLSSIWEGSGNVIALDLLRAATTLPASVEAYLAECALAKGADRRFGQALRRVEERAAALRRRPAELAGEARLVAGELALLLAASLLLRFSPAPLGEAFCATRLAGGPPSVYGALPAGLPFPALLERALFEG